jgi:hypothetical protein
MDRTDEENRPVPDDSNTSPQTIDLEVLGRKRPDVFPNTFYEVLFCGALLVSMLMSVCSL